MRGFACHRRYRRRGALLPHLFTLTLVAQGGIFSVPLSVRLPCPGVTRRTALWSSDFPPPEPLRDAVARAAVLSGGDRLAWLRRHSSLFILHSYPSVS